MQIITEEAGTFLTAMAVIHTEKRTRGPFFLLAVRWFGDLRDNHHTVLVGFSDYALVGVRAVGLYLAVDLRGFYGGGQRGERGKQWRRAFVEGVLGQRRGGAKDRRSVG